MLRRSRLPLFLGIGAGLVLAAIALGEYAGARGEERRPRKKPRLDPDSDAGRLLALRARFRLDLPREERDRILDELIRLETRRNPQSLPDYLAHVFRIDPHPTELGPDPAPPPTDDPGRHVTNEEREAALVETLRQCLETEKDPEVLAALRGLLEEYGDGEEPA